jgi:uncharacterized protein YggE
MKRSLLIVFLSAVALLLAACSGAPLGGPAVPYSPVVRQITSQGMGQVYLTPDVAYISIGVQSQSDQVAAALKENNVQAEKVASTLKEMGVEAKDIQTSAFNISPQQQFDPNNGQVTGTTYVVNNTIYVTVRKLDNLGPMLDAVVRSGANNIYGIQFDVLDKQKALADAKKMAIDNAKANAAELAGNAGVELGKLMSLNVYTNNTPQPMYEGKGGVGAGAAQVPVAAGQLVLSVTADMAYEIK